MIIWLTHYEGGGGRWSTCGRWEKLLELRWEVGVEEFVC